jgi:hypothetical protein
MVDVRGFAQQWLRGEWGWMWWGESEKGNSLETIEEKEKASAPGSLLFHLLTLLWVLELFVCW